MIEKRQIRIRYLNQDRTLHIYTPPGFNSKTKLPVLYMFDGHNLFYDSDATYGKSWGLSSYLDAHNINLIVVGIECNHEGNERINEFSPYSFNDEYIGKIKGTGNQFLKFMVEELKPFIDEFYHPQSGKQTTYIGGSSMGGLMSIAGIIKYNNVFDAAICISSYLNKVKVPLLKDIKKAGNLSGRVYLSWGEYESNNLKADSLAQLEVASSLTASGLLVFPELVKDGTHNEKSWETLIPDFINKLNI